MATILTTFGTGGANMVPGGAQGTPTLATALRDIADDLTELRTRHNALVASYNLTLAKLDADAANTALDDTDYAATNPGVAAAALLTIKG